MNSGKVEILPHPNNPGGLVVFFPNKEENDKEKIKEIQKAVFDDLSKLYKLREVEVERRETYYFSILPLPGCFYPELREDLKHALCLILSKKGE